MLLWNLCLEFDMLAFTKKLFLNDHTHHLLLPIKNIVILHDISRLYKSQDETILFGLFFAHCPIFVEDL